MAYNTTFGSIIHIPNLTKGGFVEWEESLRSEMHNLKIEEFLTGPVAAPEHLYDADGVETPESEEAYSV